jgi:hypothetical protein
MSTKVSNPDAPKSDSSKPAETPVDRRLNRVADELAEKAEETEQRYDQNHSIFTK